ASLRERLMQVGVGVWRNQDGNLVTTGESHSSLMYRKPLPAGTAIEFTGISLPNYPVGDLAVVWTESDPAVESVRTPWDYQGRTWLIQVAAYDNSFAAISARPGQGRMDLSPLRITPGKAHRIRVEIGSNDITLSVDGTIIARHHEVVPIGTGYIGIFGYYPGKAFDDLTIRHRGMPELVPVLSVGDSYFQDGLYQRAAEKYALIRHAHPNTELAKQARFREGLSRYQAGDTEQAFMLWQHLDRAPWRWWVGLQHIRHAASEGDHDKVLTDFPKLFNEANDAVQHALVRTWIGQVNALKHDQSDLFNRYLQLHDELFSGEVLTNEPVALALRRAGRFAEIVDRFTTDPWVLKEGLWAQGRFKALQDQCPDPQSQARALLQMGEFERLFEEYPHVVWAIREAVAMSGALDRLPAPGIESKTYRNLQIFSADSQLDATNTGTLLLAGQFDEAIARWSTASEEPADDADSGGNPFDVMPALLALNRDAELLALETRSPPRRRLLAWHQVLLAAMANQNDLVTTRVADIDQTPYDFAWEDSWFPEFMFRAWLPMLNNDRAQAQADIDAVSKATAESFSLRAWFLCEFIQGRVTSEEFLKQPAAYQAEAMLHLAQGMRAELKGADTATKHYAAYLALPQIRRVQTRMAPDIFIDRFCAWRLKVLGALP
ncbi:MAG: hypothetical protein PF961_20875, partial [Planctomycetota bacterium]|nr:hypothetical protein [Planctomycetota bacterium]